MSKIDPREVSEEYYRFVDGFTQSDFEDEKMLGKFYTDLNVAKNMSKSLFRSLEKNDLSEYIKVIDPFCGDGRLIISLLSQFGDIWKRAGKRIMISIWDIDGEAVEIAKRDILRFCNEAGLECQIDARQCDAFVEYGDYQGQYDISITNPPWSLLKPQKLFAKTNCRENMNDYKRAIEQYDSYMKNEFLLSQPSSKFGKWGTNLARCGTELAFKLVKENGFCCVVSPASLLSDQVSGKLRFWIFENYNVTNIAYYPAELKLYGSADISSITIVAKNGSSNKKLEVKIWKDDDVYVDSEMSVSDLEYLKMADYRVPLTVGIESVPIMKSLEKMPSTNEFCIENNLRFTREIDETRVKEKLIESGTIEFAKGYMVNRYNFKGDGFFLNEEMVTPPQTCFMSKIVWRDVSRDSQIRRIKATYLPPGYICGNSLGVICGTEETLPSLKMLLAIMNSMVYEYQVRSMLISNHVSSGTVKKARVPQLKAEKDIVELVDKQLIGEAVEDEIELLVARLYGLTVDQYSTVVSSFKIEPNRRVSIIERYKKAVQEGEQ